MAAQRNRWADALAQAREAAAAASAPVPASIDADELYEERAAILEFDAGMTRADAEALARSWHPRSRG